MLEVVLSDFARLESETSSHEDSAQAAYDKMMDETNQEFNTGHMDFFPVTGIIGRIGEQKKKCPYGGFRG